MNNNILLYVGGAFRSGSTLLSYILSNHPKIVSVSQLFQLPSQNEYCTCGNYLYNCPFWNDVSNTYTELSGQSYEQILKLIEKSESWNSSKFRMVLILLQLLGNSKLFRYTSHFSDGIKNQWNMARANLTLFRAIREISDKPVVIDSSKKPIRLKSLYLAEPKNFRLIHLVRDGRAVIWSYMRSKKFSIEEAADIWKMANINTLLMAVSIPKNQKIRVKYEDLCCTPSKVIQDILTFLNLEQVKRMTFLHKNEAHFVGGNLMRFRKEENTIVLDEQWRNNLTQKDLVRFKYRAGWLNRYFGYHE
jgi:hypothetical protein